MDKAPGPPEPALMALIARELATEAYELDEILFRYKLTDEYYEEHVKTNPFFQRVLADYTKEWHSLGSTPARLKFYAQAALEEKLPVLADRMGDRGSALTDAVNTAKLFRDLAGIAPPTPGAGVQSGEKFTISINFGDHKVAVEARESQSSLPLLEGQVERPAATTHSEIQNGAASLREIAEGTSRSSPESAEVPTIRKGEGG